MDAHISRYIALILERSYVEVPERALLFLCAAISGGMGSMFERKRDTFVAIWD